MYGMVKRGEFRVETSNAFLSAPLQQLMDEHVALRKDMDHFYEITEEIESDSGPAVVQLFAKLHERVSAFSIALKAHSKREDEGLFPMMSRRLGENDRTIAVMEEEHEKAEGHLQDFLSEAEQAGSSIDENAAQWITVYAVQAYATLTQHFAKEEKVLFPMAEKILSLNEKQELEHRFQVL
jgi:regulator of cell morphogenesis and NO signaling